MNVLSLFDGMSCGQIALERAGVEVVNYYASEIDKYAMQVAKANYPNTIHIGDVTQVTALDVDEIGLLIGGSPCQGFSFAGKQLNFEDPRSKLFFEFVRLLKEVKPKYFFLENVKMKKEYQDVISYLLGVEPIEINSALVSAQNRKRLYWTNIPNISQPKDKGILLKDILQENPLTPTISRALNVSEKFLTNYLQYDVSGKNHGSQDQRAFYENNKSGCFTRSLTPKILLGSGKIRHLSRIECERLQTVPDNYTSVISLSKAREAIGNGWTVDVVAHLFKGLKNG